MEESQNPQKREPTSTYVVQDRQNQQELHRLTVQDQLATTVMGGVLPEQPDVAHIHRILDVGCGTGGWAIEAAKTYPHMSVVGIDISNAMIDYARTQATEQHVADRVEFRVMDALKILEFPDDSFDLVNLRLGIGWVRTWSWPQLLSEMLRITCPEGVIRLTETDNSQPNSPMLRKWNDMLIRSLYKAGSLFEQEVNGLTAHLATLLKQYGVQNVQTRSCSMVYQGGTPQGKAFCDDVSDAMKTSRLFLQKWGGIPTDYEAICEQARQEMQQPDFRVTWNTLTAWGTKPA